MDGKAEMPKTVPKGGTDPKGCMIRLGRRFAGNNDGQTAIEFSFVLVPFFALMFSVFENGFLLMADDGLAQANTTAARQVLIGTVQGDTTVTTAAQYLDKFICNPTAYTRVLPSYVDCSQIIVDVRAFAPGSTFTTAVQNSDFYTTPNTNLFCTGSTGSIVMVRLMYPMPAYFPIISSSFKLAATGTSSAGLTTINGNLVHVVLTTAVFQNEPFNAVTTLKPGC